MMAYTVVLVFKFSNPPIKPKISHFELYNGGRCVGVFSGETELYATLGELIRKGGKRHRVAGPEDSGCHFVRITYEDIDESSRVSKLPKSKLTQYHAHRADQELTPFTTLRDALKHVGFDVGALEAKDGEVSFSPFER